MARPRRGWRIGTWMLAIVALAIALRVLLRPMPLECDIYGMTTYFSWSDGSATIDTVENPYPDEFHQGCGFVLVHWSDGSRSLYLDRPIRDRPTVGSLE